MSKKGVLIRLLSLLIIVLLFVKCFFIIMQHEDGTTSIGCKFNPFSDNEIVHSLEEETKELMLFFWSDHREAFHVKILQIIFKIPLILYVAVFLYTSFFVDSKKPARISIQKDKTELKEEENNNQ